MKKGWWKKLPGDGNWVTDDGRFRIEPAGFQWNRSRGVRCDYYRMTDTHTGTHYHGTLLNGLKEKANLIAIRGESNAAVQERKVPRKALLEHFVNERTARRKPKGVQHTGKNTDEG